MVRLWDRRISEFVEVPIQRTLDDDLACIDCRYFDEESHLCQGVGSSYYRKKVPQPNFAPRKSECEVRLSPDLLSFAGI